MVVRARLAEAVGVAGRVGDGCGGDGLAGSEAAEGCEAEVFVRSAPEAAQDVSGGGMYEMPVDEVAGSPEGESDMRLGEVAPDDDGVDGLEDVGCIEIEGSREEETGIGCGGVPGVIDKARDDGAISGIGIGGICDDSESFWIGIERLCDVRLHHGPCACAEGEDVGVRHGGRIDYDPLMGVIIEHTAPGEEVGEREDVEGLLLCGVRGVHHGEHALKRRERLQLKWCISGNGVGDTLCVGSGEHHNASPSREQNRGIELAYGLRVDAHIAGDWLTYG